MAHSLEMNEQDMPEEEGSFRGRKPEDLESVDNLETYLGEGIEDARGGRDKSDEGDNSTAEGAALTGDPGSG